MHNQNKGRIFVLRQGDIASRETQKRFNTMHYIKCLSFNDSASAEFLLDSSAEIENPAEVVEDYLRKEWGLEASEVVAERDEDSGLWQVSVRGDKETEDCGKIRSICEYLQVREWESFEG